MKPEESNQDTQKTAFPGCSAASLAAMDGGHAIELSGTILASGRRSWLNSSDSISSVFETTVKPFIIEFI